jgi:hypothetical protein
VDLSPVSRDYHYPGRLVYVLLKKDQRNPHNPLIRDYFCICFFEIIATSRVIAPLQDGEESPDSIGQCTGEEPGICHPEFVEGDK